MANDNFDAAKARTNMIQQMVRPWRVLNQRVLDALDLVPRDQFAPEEYRGIAYSEIRIPLNAQVKMLSPLIEARFLQEAVILPSDRVLIVGTGSGFLAACASRLGESVVTIDRDSALNHRAKAITDQMGYQNITYIDLELTAENLTELGQFDVVILTGSLREMDEAFYDLLGNRGRILAVVGEKHAMSMCSYHRLDETIQVDIIFETDLERLVGYEDRPTFVF